METADNSVAADTLAAFVVGILEEVPVVVLVGIVQTETVGSRTALVVAFVYIVPKEIVG